MFLSSNGKSIQTWPCTDREHFQVPDVWTRHLVASRALMERFAELRKTATKLEFVAESDRLAGVIDEAEWILGLKDDFDGRGSPRYSKETLERAVAFVRLQWQEYLRLNVEPMPLPEIEPGPRGSIDIFWDLPDLNLLVNIPADPELPVEFAGDSKGRGRFDGALVDPTKPNRGLVSWLAG